MKKAVLTAVLALAMVAGPAFADSVHIGGNTNITNQGGQGGNASAAASASATGGTHIQTNNQTRDKARSRKPTTAATSRT